MLNFNPSSIVDYFIVLFLDKLNCWATMYGYIFCIKKYVTIIGVITRIVCDVFNRIRIINNEWTVIGFITTIDILYNIKGEKDINNNTIGYTMTVNPTVIKQNKDFEDHTVGVKNKNNISMIPVLEDYERIIGICSRSDILKETLKDRFVVIGIKKLQQQ